MVAILVVSVTTGIGGGADSSTVPDDSLHMVLDTLQTISGFVKVVSFEAFGVIP